MTETPLLDHVNEPKQLRLLDEYELDAFAQELRQATINTVSKTGGHLGAGLGVVELTTAIHYVFDTPNDKLIWDVGHQCYPHKIITGRKDRIQTLRQAGGLSGFTKRAESDYDPFGAAHASTSISAGLGFAVSRDLQGHDDHVICVIGDGAMSAGMAYEAMNNAGAMDSRLIVILNDNDMSIAPPVGAMSSYLARIVSGGAYQSFRNFGKKIAGHLPGPIYKTAQKAEGFMRDLATGGSMFEEMGFYYVGPIDGHNVSDLLEVLRNAKEMERPVLIHAVTQKGKGYPPAEASADKYHGVAKFDVVTGSQQKSKANAPSYTKVFGQTLTKLAQTDEKIVAITAAMPSGTGVNIFAESFPERSFDVGIAEQHAVTFAAGLAADGMKPFAAIYSTFLQRGYDQVVHDVAIQKLPVRFALDRAGLVGADGCTHAGAFDIGYLGALPGMVVMAASDEAQLARMTATAASYDEGPIAFRYPRGEGVGVELPEMPELLEIGKGKIVKEGEKIALLSLGTRLAPCLEASQLLERQGLSTTVADAIFAKPLDTDLVECLAWEHQVLVTVEEGARGGFGAFVLQHLAQAGLLDAGLSIRTLTLPDRFQDQDKPEIMYQQAGLDAQSIADTALSALGFQLVEQEHRA